MSMASQPQHLAISEEEQKPLSEPHHAGHQQDLGSTFTALTDSCAHEDVEAHESILAPADSAKHNEHWGLGKYLKAGIARFTRDAAYYHYGNFVCNRVTGGRTFEQMPIYTRVGMHILYCGSVELAMLKSGYAQQLFIQESYKTGKAFDSPSSKSKIPGFISTFALPLDDLLEPDPDKYETFNEFFARALKEGARPVSDVDDETVVVSSADCRLVVFPTLNLATDFWIKGRKFTIPNLLAAGGAADALTAGASLTSEEMSGYDGGGIAIFRLAPQDYHRWHTPISGTVQKIVSVAGTLMTVNPMAINEDLNVYTENKRSIAYIKTPYSKLPVLVVAVGAMLVGSIEWTVKVGDQVKKGQEMGFFKYGGSTVLMITPGDMKFQFDADLVRNSEGQVSSGNSGEAAGKEGITPTYASGACETQVRVGERIGRVVL